MVLPTSLRLRPAKKAGMVFAHVGLHFVALGPLEKDLTRIDSSDTIRSRYETSFRWINTFGAPSWCCDFDFPETRIGRRGKERAMKKLQMLFLLGVTLLLGAAPLAAQNTVDVIAGPQPTNTTGCNGNPQCIPATWSTPSNGGMDITTAITKNFVFAKNGGAMPSDFPGGTTNQICLADTRDLPATPPTLFLTIAANCKTAGGVALLLIRDSAVNAPSVNTPVFTISTANGDFLRGTVGCGSPTSMPCTATNNVSTYLIRIN